MGLIWKPLKSVFFALPGIVAFFVAAAALAVIYMEELQQKLKDRRYIRWAVAIVLLIMGAAAFISDRIQKEQEQITLTDTIEATASRVSTSVTNALNEQYGTKLTELYRDIAKLEAERSDEVALNYAPSADLIFAGDRLQLWNRGRTNLSIWGNKYDSEVPHVENAPVVIAPTDHYYFLVDRLQQAVLRKLGKDGDDRVPIIFYVNTANGTKYTMLCTLWEVMRDGKLTVHTQCHGFTKKDWTHEVISSGQ